MKSTLIVLTAQRVNSVITPWRTVKKSGRGADDERAYQAQQRPWGENARPDTAFTAPGSQCHVGLLQVYSSHVNKVC